MAMKYYTIDVGMGQNQLDCWVNFMIHIYKKHPHQLKEYQSYRKCIEKELQQFKATFITDDTTYAKLVFENENYKTLFLMQWS